MRPCSLRPRATFRVQRTACFKNSESLATKGDSLKSFLSAVFDSHEPAPSNHSFRAHAFSVSRQDFKMGCHPRQMDHLAASHLAHRTSRSTTLAASLA